MVTLNWCKKQKKGIKLIEPSNNLAKEYLESAEETLEILKEIQGKSKMWLATTKYYFEYFLIYSLLIKIGIKCEIHECTIEVAKTLEKNKLLEKGINKQLEYDKQLRIDNQYYLKNREVKIDYERLLNLFLNIKNKVNKLTLTEINKIREIIGEK